MTAQSLPSHGREAITHVQNRVLELIATGAPLRQTLDELARLVEVSSSDGMLASILILDEDGGHLRHGGAPSLPAAYNAAIDGISIGPEVGSCGTAAFRGQTVVVSDIERDPLWRNFRDLALAHGLRACWSTPILGSNGAIVGTFANYYTSVRDPSPTDRELTQLITRTAAIAIENAHRRDRLAREMARLQRLYRLTDMLGRAHAIDELYDEAMSAVQDLLGVRRVSILLFDPDGVMRFKAWRGISDEYRAAVEGHTPWTPETVDASPIVVPDVREDASLASYLPVFEREQIRGLGFFPLRTHHVLGKFMVYFDQPRRLTGDELLVAEAISQHMAIAVERAQHEEKLDRTNAILSGLFQQTSDAVFVKDRDGRYLMVNAAAAAVAGTEASRMIGRTAADVFDEATSSSIIQRDEALMREGVMRTLEEPITNDGRRRVFLSTKGPWRDADGKVLGLIGISRDITDRKHAEEELELRARRQAAIADFGIVALSDIAVQELNEGAAALARELMETDCGVVSALLDDGASLRRVAFSGDCDGDDQWSSLAERVATAALRDDTPVLVPDAGIGAVVHGRHEPYGVLTVLTRSPRRFTTDDAYCIQVLANLLGMAIERRITADASREREERFRSLSACSPTGIFLTDIDGRCNYTNPSCDEICGFTIAEAAGTGWAEFVHADDRAEVFRAWPEAAAAGRGFDRVFRFVHKDGTVRWTHVRTAPVFGDHRQLIGHVGTVEDITDTRQITDALRGSEERYRSLVTATAQVVWTAAADGSIEDMPRWRELTGQSIDQVRGRGWLDAVHPADRAATVAAFDAALARTEGCEVEYRLRMKDGTYRWFVMRAVPVANADGSIREWVGTCSDIDDRRHALDSLALLSEASAMLASSLVLDEMLDQLARLLLERGADHCLIVLGGPDDAVAHHIAHRDPAVEATLRQFLARNPLGENPQFPVRRVIASGEPMLISSLDADDLARSEDQRAHFRRLGTASVMILPLAARSRVLGALVIGSEERGHYRERDLLVAAELAGRAALAIDNAALFAEAQEASRAKDDFLATLSHELRTPMTAILGWTRMLQLADLDAETRRLALQSIDRSTRAQAQIVEDILDVSRIITGKMTIEPRPIQLAAVIEAAVDAVRPAAEAKQIALQLDVPRTRRTVAGDPNRLQQVVWNLVSNAIKFTPPRGSVHVGVRYDSEGATIAVTDSGEGIAPELLPHVFERFRQADSSSTRVHGGLGLGLAIVRHLVELHGGTVAAESGGAGMGARFTVRLPLRRATRAVVRRRAAEGAADAAADAGPRLPSLRRTRVLVVDDEEQTRTFVSTLLASCGAEVRTSGSVVEALAALDGWSPHVLVSDLAMPHQDGYELIAHVQGQRRRSPMTAIALTAYGRPEDRERALAAGFAHFMQKPVEPLELARLVASGKPRRARART